MTPKHARTAFIIFFGVMVAAFLYMAAPLMKSIFLAAIIAVVFHPVYKLILKVFRQHNYIAAVATTVLSFFVVLLPITIILMMLTSELVEFATRLAGEIQSGHFAPVVDHIGGVINGWLAGFYGGKEMLFDLRVEIVGFLKEAGHTLYQFSPKVLASTARVALGLVVMIIFMVVFFAEGSRLFAWLVRSMPLSESHQEEISREIRVMISAILLGMAATAVVQGALVGFGFWAASFEEPFMWGAVAVLAAFIPIVGASSCYLGAVAILASMGRMNAALIFLAYGVLIVSSVDNLIKPLVMGGRMRVHPVLLFVALLGGMRAFGPIGIVFGPVLLAVFLASLRIYQREFTAPQ